VVEPQRVEVEPAVADDPWQVAERVCQRRRFRVRVDEDERAPGADRHRHEPGAVLREPRLGPRRGA
jgi:hypothetical protein